MTVILLGLTGAVLLVAGPVMIVRGLVARRTVTHELADQRIRFPAGDGLPERLARYAGVAVHTGDQARAYSDLIAVHVSRATQGRSYAELAEAARTGGDADTDERLERLERLRQTAFMGQSLRGALLGAYQAWQISLLVMGVGALFVVMGAAFLALAIQQPSL